MGERRAVIVDKSSHPIELTVGGLKQVLHWKIHASPVETVRLANVSL